MTEPSPPPTAIKPWSRIHLMIACLALVAIALHLLLRFGLVTSAMTYNVPLLGALVLGGTPLIVELFQALLRRELGADLLAGLSIVTSVLLGEYLAGTLVVLMLSGGNALESYAVRSASSVLAALAKRMPSVAHRQQNQQTQDVALAEVAIGDLLVVHPHEICPVDGEVVSGHGVMDESYLTGEPFHISKTPGSTVLSGAINGESVLTIRATRLAVDSRYAKIMEVMQGSSQQRPRMRRIGDQLGAYYTPLAILLASGAWLFSGESQRFLAVLVVATPCPLLIAIPVAIIGSISLSARRGIIVKDPAILEQIDTCRTAIFDKTGTLTYGRPALTETLTGSEFNAREVLMLAASLEHYSKHPLAVALLQAAEKEGITLPAAEQISERPGEGLRGVVQGRQVQVTSRNKMAAKQPELVDQLPPLAAGLECVVLVDGAYAATFRFRDTPRAEGKPFVSHLGPNHQLTRVMIISGDRESEVSYLAGRLGIQEFYAEKSPEEKLALVRAETAKAPTIYLGDGINDAPALLAATVGVALGQNSDIIGESAGAVVMEASLTKVDELLHIGVRLRRIVLQSAVGGMALSLIGMLLAAAGYLPPVAGALLQEAIDVLAVTNALRAAWPPRELSDF